MNKLRNKRFSLARETLRTLATVELEHVVAGLGAATVGPGAHPLTCTCVPDTEHCGGGHQQQ